MSNIAQRAITAKSDTGDRLRSSAAALHFSAILALPLITLIFLALSGDFELWPHLVANVLPRAFGTTLVLIVGVGVISAILGVSTAWFVSMTEFPGRSLAEWALLLPLAVPTYISAYAYVDLLDYSGPVQEMMRSAFQFQSARDYWFPDIRSMPGGIFVLAMVLYPYVYLAARASFLMQSVSELEAARVLGAPLSRVFRTIALPLVRPALFAGLALVTMETINDIGAVEFFGIQTLTFAIFVTWLNLGDFQGAAQLALVLLILVSVVVMLEKWSRRQLRDRSVARLARRAAPKRLSGWPKYAVIGVCLTPITLGFVVPVGQLIAVSLRRGHDVFNIDIIEPLSNTVVLAALSSVVVLLVAITQVYFANRIPLLPVSRFSIRLPLLGYAIPGTILAIGILYPLALFDNAIDAVFETLFGINTGLLLTGSGAALVYAYGVRFLAVGAGSIYAADRRLNNHFEMAARTLERTRFQAFYQVALPQLRPALTAAFLLVFVDVMKELPATLMLRPFDFDTLATTVYNFASREEFEAASFPALLIIVAGLLPIFVINKISLGADAKIPQQRNQQ